MGSGEWIAALDKMESLNPPAVIAGHKRVGNHDSPKILGETRRYIRDFERLAMQTTTARELYDQVLKLYPLPFHSAFVYSMSVASTIRGPLFLGARCAGF